MLTTVLLFPGSPQFCPEEQFILTDFISGIHCNGEDIGVTGLVSVCLNEAYVPVCNSGFDLEGAQKFCDNYLGFSGYTIGELGNLILLQARFTNVK